jgi:hypothetical protein
MALSLESISNSIARNRSRQRLARPDFRFDNSHGINRITSPRRELAELLTRLRGRQPVLAEGYCIKTASADVYSEMAKLEQVIPSTPKPLASA